MVGKITLRLVSVLLVSALFATPALAQDGGTDAATDVTTTDAMGDATGDAFAPPCSETLARTCTANGNECGDNGLCLLVTNTIGVCTCQCTPDDPTTETVDEDDCGGDNRCGLLQLQSGYYNLCFRKCQPRYGENDCNTGFSCSPWTTQIMSWDEAICLLPGCSTDDDCPVILDTTCDTTMTGQCGADETCEPLEEGSTDGLCVKPGKCDVVSGLCDKHPTTNPTAEIGDPCKTDLDCGEYMDCQREYDPAAEGLKADGEPCISDDDCCGTCNPLSGCEGPCLISARNGYCSLRGCALATATDYTEHACPAGSTCHRLFSAGVCFKTCDPANASDCRGNPNDFYGDYECRSWNRVELETGVNYSDAPVCEFGGIISCAVGLDCAELGEENNPHDMACRNPDGTATTSPTDPAGSCMDTTSSGPMPPPPPDAGPTPDSGVDATPDTVVVPDTTTPDSEVTEDSAVEPDAEDDDADVEEDAATNTDAEPESDASVTPKDDDGGCSCQVGTAPQPWLLLGLLALLFRRRRR